MKSPHDKPVERSLALAFYSEETEGELEGNNCVNLIRMKNRQNYSHRCHFRYPLSREVRCYGESRGPGRVRTLRKGGSYPATEAVPLSCI
jgi:hypothetical protein